eukprot:TRINITY_DN76336_c0_g1_i1.p1 TRINITY_DN76336_c0_g1~~TRINITY_DN76336_c0_g1_i1.p1  ORF type:complete len:589 (+),score=94.52 TRINITY_DN76336_c0_g1_i1:83-1768(+)
MASAEDKAVETKAEAQTEPQKPKSIPMLKATDGKKYCFEEDAIIVLISKGFFSTPAKERLSWSSIQKCDLQWGCFSAILTLSLEDGQTIMCRGGSGKVKRAVAVVHDRLNTEHQDNSLDEYKDVLKQVKGRTRIEGAGISIEYTTCFGCRGESHFVPWDCVVSAKLTIGCFGESILMKTMIEQKKDGQCKVQNTPKATQNDEKDTKKDDGRSSDKEQLVDSSVASYVEVTLKGKKGCTRDIFRIISGLMAKGKTDEPVEGVPAIKRATVSEAGVFSGYASKQLFLPWTSMTSVDYAAKLFGSAAVVVTDRCGDQCVLKGVTHEGFLKFREIFLKSGKSLASGSDLDPIVRKNLTIMPNGVIVSHRKWFSKYTRSYPWSVVDAANLTMTCCGGTLVLCTEGGERIPVYNASCFSTGKLHEVWNRIREMKYRLDNEHTGHPVWFAGKPHRPTTCMLTDKSMRLTSHEGFCKQQVHLVDLDSVREVKAQKEKGCCKPHYLKVTFLPSLKVNTVESAEKDPAPEGKTSPSTSENTIVVKLTRSDNGPSLAKEIMKRSKERQGEEP